VAALRFVAREVSLHQTVVHFKHDAGGRRTYGLAYDGIPAIANLDGLRSHEWRYLVTVTDQGEDTLTPRIVQTLAHEGKHIEQYRRGLGPSEPPCDAFGAWAADRWQRHGHGG